LPGLVRRVVREMKALGVCDYIEKPFGIGDLMAVLERHTATPESTPQDGPVGSGADKAAPSWILKPSHA